MKASKTRQSRSNPNTSVAPARILKLVSEFGKKIDRDYEAFFTRLKRASGGAPVTAKRKRKVSSKKKGNVISLQKAA